MGKTLKIVRTTDIVPMPKYSLAGDAGFDLYVAEKHRGKGIGKKLFDQIIEKGKKINAKQLHWQVLDWNTPAIEFYKKYGASIDAEWLDCKMYLEGNG